MDFYFNLGIIFKCTSYTFFIVYIGAFFFFRLFGRIKVQFRPQRVLTVRIRILTARILWLHIHIARAGDKPLKTDVGHLAADGLHRIQGGFGAAIEDAAQGCLTHADVLGKSFLSHIRRLHNLAYSVSHFYASIVFRGR